VRLVPKTRPTNLYPTLVLTRKNAFTRSFWYILQLLRKEEIMFRFYLIGMIMVLIIGCDQSGRREEQKALAEKYFRGIYGSDSTVVDELAADNIIISYPIFQKIFNKSVIKGKDAVRHFSNRFSNRWSEPKVTFHDVVAESDKVMLVWGFKARNVGSIQPGIAPSGKEESWGGITFIRFNRDGKVEAEIGEESSPGPIERLTNDN
jgi:SnoaL-like domain